MVQAVIDSEALTVDQEAQIIDLEVIAIDVLETVEKAEKAEKGLEVDSASQVQLETEEIALEAPPLPTTTDLVAAITIGLGVIITTEDSATVERVEKAERAVKDSEVDSASQVLLETKEIVLEADLTATPTADLTATPTADLIATPTTDLTATPTADLLPPAILSQHPTGVRLQPEMPSMESPDQQARAQHNNGQDPRVSIGQAKMATFSECQLVVVHQHNILLVMMIDYGDY